MSIATVLRGRRAIAVATTAAAATAVVALGVPAMASAAPAASARVLRAGQTGTRAEVPWSRVGPGWALVTSTTAALPGTPRHSARTGLYLVDSDGGKYLLYRTRTPAQLLAWSGDARRALVSLPTRSGGWAISQLALSSGRLTPVVLPKNEQVIGYTWPLGASLLTYSSGRNNASTEFARYTLTGHLQKRLATIPGEIYGGSTFYAPDGELIATATVKGIYLVSNATRSATRIPAADGCTVDSWWNATSIVTSSCSGRQLYLVPVGGGRARLLARVPQGARYQFLGGAWGVHGGVYVQVSGPAAGTSAVSRLVHGRLEGVSVNGQGLRGIVIAAGPSRLLLAQQSDGGFQTGLTWYDPANKTEGAFLTPPQNEQGVTSWEPYYVPSGQN